MSVRSAAFIISWFSMLAIVLMSSPVARANSFDGEVVKAFFTNKIVNNKPHNEVLLLENSTKRLQFYSEVQGMKGKILYHVWEHRGEKLFKKKFKVTKDSQSLVSSYTLSPTRTGEWMALITDEQGLPIKAVMFRYVKKGSLNGKGIIKLR